MIFLELVLQNFGPYRGRQVLNLRPQVNDHSRPIILLGGMNGGGKTTLMDAIRLALYGSRAECSTRGNLSYSDFLTQCVNSHTPPTEKTRIELVFEHIENDKPVTYRVVRTWEKNPKDGKDSLGILDGKEWLNTALANIWDEYIENLLPLGISNLFLFDGEQVKELAQQETPPPVVVDAIRGLLGLELAERLAADLEILVNRKRKAVADTQDLANLEEIEQKLKQQQEQYKVETQNFESLQEKLKEAEKKQQEAFDKFVSEGGKIASDRAHLEKQQQEKTLFAEQARQAMAELAADILPLALIQPLLIQASSQAEKEFRTQQAQIAKNILLEREQRLINFITNLAISSEEFDKIKTFLVQENLVTEREAAEEESWLDRKSVV